MALNNERTGNPIGSTRPPYSKEELAKAEALYVAGYSFTQICEAIGCPRVRTITNWVKKYKWQRSVGSKGPLVNSQTGRPNGEATKAAIVPLVTPAIKAYIERTVAEAVEEHIKVADKLLKLGVGYLEQIAPRSIGDVISMLKTGVEIERQARGMDPNPKGGGTDGRLSGDTILNYIEKVYISKKPEVEQPTPIAAEVAVNGAAPTPPEEPKQSETPEAVN